MGFPKAKLAIGNTPLLLQMAERLSAANWQLTCVVVAEDELAHWVNGLLPGIPVIINDFPDDGKISSLRLALRWAEGKTPGLLAWPVDHPLIEIETLRLMRQASTKVNVVIPLFEGKRGHPTWWGRTSWKLLKSNAANFGAKFILRPLSLNIAEVKVDDPGVLINVDTLETAATFGLGEAR